jgi:hypothetical protein
VEKEKRTIHAAACRPFAFGHREFSSKDSGEPWHGSGVPILLSVRTSWQNAGLGRRQKNENDAPIVKD